MDLATLALIFSAATDQFNLPKGLLSALCYVESHHNISAVNKDDGDSESLGICQVKLETAQSLGFKGTRERLMGPRTNIHYAAKYLKQQLDRYDNSIYKAISAYNSGTYKASKKIMHIMSQQVSVNHKYVLKVWRRWEQM